jgi:hypothetical protein
MCCSARPLLWSAVFRYRYNGNETSGIRSKLGFARVCDVAGVDMLSLPVHFVIWVPQMAQSAFTWKASPYIWTREILEVSVLQAAIAAASPARISAPAATAIDRLRVVLKCGGRR